MCITAILITIVISGYKGSRRVAINDLIGDVKVAYRMKILFLCSQNKKRSLTAERIFNGVNGHIVCSSGTERNSRMKVTPGIIGWADIIYCMEKKHVRRIREKYNDLLTGKEVICLNIPDDYAFMDEELISLLQSIVLL